MACDKYVSGPQYRCQTCGEFPWQHYEYQDRRTRDRAQPGLFAPKISESEQRFLNYHEENPHVYAKMVEYALMVKRRGKRDKWGINGLIERTRWFADFETTDPNWGSDFKINNNYAPHYARLIMKHEPELAGFFDIRALRAG